MTTFALQSLPTLSALSITNQDSGRTLVLSREDARKLVLGLCNELGMQAITQMNVRVRRTA